MFLGGLPLSNRRQPDSRAGAAFRFQSLFSFGIGVAALGALVAGQLPGWLRHLPQGFTRAITRPAGSRSSLLVAQQLFRSYPYSD